MHYEMHRKSSDIYFDLFIKIILSFILILVLYPLIYVLSASVSDPLLVIQGKVILWPVGINLDAYKRVFNNANIVVGYKNTLIYTFLGTAINLIMTTAGAYPLSRRDFKGRNFLTFFFSFTMFFSGGMIPTYLLIKRLGMINTIWALVIPPAVSVWNMVIMRTFFSESVPWELQEAAWLDGCSNIGILTRIVLPLSKPVIAVMIMFYAVSHWNSYFSALIYISDRNKYPLTLILREILIQSQMTDMGSDDLDVLKQILMTESLKYSVMMVASIPVLMLYPIAQKYFVKGMMVGALKG